MNTQFKVGQRVKVITGANVTTDIFNGMEGVITEIQDNGTPKVMIYVDFENGYKIWCYTQNHRGITLNVEILDQTQKWLPIDRENLPTCKVVAIDYPAFNDVYYGTLELTEDSGIRLYIGSGSYLYKLTHYIPLSDLLNLPIAE